jgi:hypothetical protein
MDAAEANKCRAKVVQGLTTGHKETFLDISLLKAVSVGTIASSCCWSRR